MNEARILCRSHLRQVQRPSGVLPWHVSDWMKAEGLEGMIETWGAGYGSGGLSQGLGGG